MKAISKKSRRGEQRLERRMLKRYDLLILNRDVCNGCGLCIEVCPKDAIAMHPTGGDDGIGRHALVTLDRDLVYVEPVTHKEPDQCPPQQSQHHDVQDRAQADADPLLGR